jgi:hypothetical protein
MFVFVSARTFKAHKPGLTSTNGGVVLIPMTLWITHRCITIEEGAEASWGERIHVQYDTAQNILFPFVPDTRGQVQHWHPEVA